MGDVERGCRTTSGARTRLRRSVPPGWVESPVPRDAREEVGNPN